MGRHPDHEWKDLPVQFQGVNGAFRDTCPHSGSTREDCRLA